MKTIHTTVTQERLRQLADRAVRVMAEHKDQHVALAGSASTVVPAAEAYIKVYDAAITARAAQRSDMETGRNSLNELWREIRVGLGAAQHALPTFDTSELAGTVESPERLFSDGHKLIELIGQGGVAQGEAIVALLKTALEKAETEWAKAQRARTVLQATQAEVRKHALALNHELVALRRLLRNVLGTSHLAYQTLRTSRVLTTDDEDDTVVEDESDEIDSPSPVVNGTNGTHPLTTGATV